MREIHPEEEEEKTLWIIRFSNGIMASCNATREKAEEYAARRAAIEGTTYEIN